MEVVKSGDLFKPNLTENSWVSSEMCDHNKTTVQQNRQEKNVNTKET